MSIDSEYIESICERNGKICDKVFSILGVDVINSNHHGDTLLFNNLIDVNTEESRILEIWNNYNKMYKEIERTFKKNGMELKNEYFWQDDMYGLILFLGVPINVDKGFSFLEATINEFIMFYKRIQLLAKKYYNLSEIVLYKDFYKKSSYYLYGKMVDLFVKDDELEKILISIDKLNKKINNLMTVCNYNGKNSFYVSIHSSYYLFGKKIFLNSSSQYLLKLMNNAQLFENNIKRVLNDLKIFEEYSIYYKTKAIVRVRTIKLEFYLGMSYDEIKNIFIENNKCFNFKKKI